MVSLQSSTQSNDELAALFSRNLTFHPELRQPASGNDLKHDGVTAPSQTQPISYSISQHYHHSAHTVKPSGQLEAPGQEEPRRPSSEPPQGESSNAEAILIDHRVDPATLTPSQLQLFRIADTSQKTRLIELWTICPPNKGEDIPALAWSSTTLEQEEHLARMRYERQSQTQAMSLDGTPVQTADGSWLQSRASDSEPYMNSGYEDLMRSEFEQQARQPPPREAYTHHYSNEGGPSYTRATDPVYMGQDYARQLQQMNMATQYGAFEQFRGAGEPDTMDVVM